ncbi:MAG: TonB-dependent receptor [uncultured Sulfurovum sp.]|uniref:TonB-dependent receptor n=1 Tax=uncultured Sulfurovum sp. TaxID=269237 RepID=A0A6S6TSU4_9BACT|nr:MAG: TonB-dependent receptor [uncultured Sulfurovum sp.]
MSIKGIYMTNNSLTLSTITATILLTSSAFAQTTENNNELDPIVISADFREAKLSQTSNAITVVGEEKLYDKASQTFVDTLASTPNVNFSTGASKAKYVQIRGIGERSQFITPINPSIGINVDGIDFSQSTLGVSMFDVKQVEVLRGPQGTTFGSNGMAGVINVTSNEPTKETTGKIEATMGNYNTKAFGAAVGGSLVEDKLLGRISVYKNKSDGFMKNSFLNREDTNNINEFATKAQLRWLATDQHTIDLNLMHSDVDNGYDAFTFDNSRTSHSDQPGKDAQETNAFSLTSTSQINSKMHLVANLGQSRSDSEYSFDVDWSNPNEFPASLYPYAAFDQYLRDREQTNMDVRLVSDDDGRIFNASTAWTLGAYYRDNNEKLIRNYDYLPQQFQSDYQTDTIATYGQLDSKITDKFTLITGLRVEKWKANYTDSDAVAINTSETLLGGKIGLNYEANEDTLIYTTLSKGYKPGGVNADNSLTATEKEYSTEGLWNLDLGVNSSHMENTLTSRLNLFYGKRDDQQVKSSNTQLRADGSTDFIDFTSNAAKGSYYGLESELNYYPNDTLHLFTSVGLLKSEFDTFNEINPAYVSLSGRAPAQSPSYQFNVGGDLLLTDTLSLKANVEGRGAAYYSDRQTAGLPAYKAKAYKLINSSLEYTNNDWTAILWARNIADEDYTTRGFGSFGNNPGNGYISELYTQQGMPRTFGVTVSRDF